MFHFNLTMVLISLVFSSTVLAYGSGGGKKACTPPAFSQFTPAKLTVVAPQSEFSFIASSLTNPDSINVSVKKQAVDVLVSKQGSRYLVTGNLPESIQSAFARITITAKGTNNCQGKDGWLLKIEAP